MINKRKKENIALNKLINLTETQKFKNIQVEIIQKSLYQQSILDAKKFYDFICNYDISLVWTTDFIYFMKQGFLTPCYYINNREKQIFDFQNIKTINEKLLKKSYFHPYRVLQAANCNIQNDYLYNIFNIYWRSKKNKRKNFKSLKEIDKNASEDFYRNKINAITEFGIVLEPIYRPIIKGSLSIHNFKQYDEFINEIKDLKYRIMKLVKIFNNEEWKQIHDNTMFFSKILDKNTELKTLITLMRSEDQKRIIGKIGISLIAREVAQLIRYAAYDNNFELPEEQYSEISRYTPQYFLYSKGSKKIVNGTRENKLKFVRGFGLDFSISARLYVEGETEYYCFKKAFEKFGFVEIINLKGNFCQKAGKGLSFIESLQNDKKSHIYSIIVLDGDEDDNIRAVKQAVKKECFLGQFFISKPDFELQNFSIEELCKIVKIHTGVLINVDDFKNINSIKTFFNKIERQYPDLNRFSKGQEWGEVLYKYSIEHPKTNPSGLNDDRIINQVIRFCGFSTLLNFANDLKDKEIDINTGRMIKRIKRK